VHCVHPLRLILPSKVIEKTQRDLNIALMNALAIIFDKVGIDTSEVLEEAAGTKWNFLKFKPGLFGGHCIREGRVPASRIGRARIARLAPLSVQAGQR
jgi:UDP-N-acetyl-D-glucosamine/UDP-N-acetyl-D-galactosamine dehydrogenase